MQSKKLLRSALLTVTAAQFVCASTVSANPKNMGAVNTSSNQFWWPERLDLMPLRQHSEKSNPLDKNFEYAKELFGEGISITKDISVNWRALRYVKNAIISNSAFAIIPRGF